MNRCAAVCLILAALASGQEVPGRKAGPKPIIPAAPPAAAPAGASGKTVAPPARPTAAAAKPAAGAAPYRDLKFQPLRPLKIPQAEWSTLPNGMRLLLLPDPELPVVTGTAYVRAGGVFDPPLVTGLASLTGNVMRTGGTSSKTGEQVDETLDGLGASIDISIARTSASVSFSALKATVPQVLAIFHDVLTAPEFRQDQIDLTKTQLRTAISHRNDNASDVVRRELAAVLYGRSTPYGQRVEYATVARISRRDVLEFHRRYFLAANTLLAIRGDFDPAAMKTRIETLFAGWTAPQQAVPEFPGTLPAGPAAIHFASRREAERLYFAIGSVGTELRSKDHPALDVAAAILGGGIQSRLYQRLRMRTGYAFDVAAAVQPAFDHPGLFVISGSAKPFSAAETISAIREEAGLLGTAEVTDEELRIARDGTIHKFVFSLDTRAKMLTAMLTLESSGYPRNFPEQYQKALAGVTRADVLRVAKQYLDPARLTVVAVANASDIGKPLTSAGLPVVELDLTIPQPGAEPAPPDAGRLARGKQILARVQQASGGAEKIAAVTDCVQVLEFTLASTAGGGKIVETDRWIAPSYFRQESQFSDRKIVAFWDGASGRISTPEGSGPLSGNQLRQVQGDLFRLYYRLLASDRISGRAVNAVADDTLEIGNNEGETARMVIDSATGLPSRILYETARPNVTYPISVEERIVEFQEVGGVKVPSKFAIFEGGRKFADVVVTDWKVNQGLKWADLQKLQ